jgi:hypothetical protein
MQQATMLFPNFPWLKMPSWWAASELKLPSNPDRETLSATKSGLTLNHSPLTGLDTLGSLA